MNESVERHNLLAFLNAALESVQGKAIVGQYLQTNKPFDGDIALLAIGKAACAMSDGATESLGDNIITGLVITKDGHCSNYKNTPGIEVIYAAHPVPDERSLSAGEHVIAWLQTLPSALPLLVLISGGTSALVEKLPEGIGLTDLQRLNHWLLASGLPIQKVNAIRSSISTIKGGRLFKSVGDRQVIQLLISDVPNDRPELIGSGPFINSPQRSFSCDSYPGWIRAMQLLAENDNDLYLDIKNNIQTTIIASNQIACEAAKAMALAAGYRCEKVHPGLEGDVHDCANTIMTYLDLADEGCYIWGGETTIELPDNPGRGGRNQHLALILAKKIQNRPEFYILCVGTDGTDGPTSDAGALVDAYTVKRGEDQGLDVSDALKKANAGTFLAASGDLINTGPTGTNVMDLVMALKVKH